MMRFPARMGPDFNEAKTVPVVTMATQMSYLIALALLQKLEKVKLYVRAIPKVRDYVRCWYDMLETVNALNTHTYVHMQRRPRARHLVIDYQPRAIPLSELPGF